MDESALQQRLDVIERRQFLIVSLIVAGYLLAGFWFLVAELETVTVWTAGVGATIGAVLVAILVTYQRRRD